MAVVILAGVFVGAIGPDFPKQDWKSFHYLYQRDWKISFLGVLGTAFALYALVGMWRIYWALKARLDVPSAGFRDLDDYLELSQDLQLLLVVLGAMLGLTILAAGAERSAVAGYADQICPKTDVLHVLGNRVLGRSPSCPSHFPSEYLLIYGFYFTALLAFAYVPVHLALMAVGRRIREAVAPVKELWGPPEGAEVAEGTEGTKPDVVAWQSKRNALDELLELKVATGANFRASIAVLTPLIGALTSILFKT